MSKITGNEPAAPSDYVITDSLGNIEGVRQKDWTGLTIRQHFAAVAIQGIYAGLYSISDLTGWGVKDIAKHAVGAADALIEELNK